MPATPLDRLSLITNGNLTNKLKLRVRAALAAQSAEERQTLKSSQKFQALALPFLRAQNI